MLPGGAATFLRTSAPSETLERASALHSLQLLAIDTLMTVLTEPGPIPANAALFLDFDGTLAGIQDDPETVALPERGAEILQALAARLDGALTILSGRDIRDLSRRVPQTLWRAGGHGLETCVPGEAPGEMPAPPAQLARMLAHAVDGLDGVRIETKGPVFAIHYRAAPHLEEALEARLQQVIAEQSGYLLERGKMIFETKPEGASKGSALVRMMERAPFVGRVPVMVGDDTTDEAAMEAANAAGGWSVKVGEGATVAKYGLADPQAVWAWLERALN